MASNKIARYYHERQVHFLTKSVTYSDADIAGGSTVAFAFGLPANAFVMNTVVRIKTVFNAATTNVLTVGTNNPTSDNLVAAADVSEAAVATTTVNGPGILSTTASLDVFVKYTQTGTAATTGAADVVVTYVIWE